MILASKLTRGLSYNISINFIHHSLHNDKFLKVIMICRNWFDIGPGVFYQDQIINAHMLE